MHRQGELLSNSTFQFQIAELQRTRGVGRSSVVGVVVRLGLLLLLETEAGCTREYRQWSGVCSHLIAIVIVRPGLCCLSSIARWAVLLMLVLLALAGLVAVGVLVLTSRRCLGLFLALGLEQIFHQCRE